MATAELRVLMESFDNLGEIAITFTGTEDAPAWAIRERLLPEIVVSYTFDAPTSDAVYLFYEGSRTVDADHPLGHVRGNDPFTHGPDCFDAARCAA